MCQSIFGVGLRSPDVRWQPSAPAVPLLVLATPRVPECHSLALLAMPPTGGVSFCQRVAGPHPPPTNSNFHTSRKISV